MAWVFLLYTGRVDSALRECFEMLYTVKSDQSEPSVNEWHLEKCDNSVLLYILNNLTSQFFYLLNTQRGGVVPVILF